MGVLGRRRRTSRRRTIVGIDEPGGVLAAVLAPLHGGARRRGRGGDGARRRGRGLAAQRRATARPSRCRWPRTTTSIRPSSSARTTSARPQRALLIAGLAIEGAVLVAVALGRPAPLRRRLERLAARPLLGGAVAGAAVVALHDARHPAGEPGLPRARRRRRALDPVARAVALGRRALGRDHGGDHRRRDGAADRARAPVPARLVAARRGQSSPGSRSSSPGSRRWSWRRSSTASRRCRQRAPRAPTCSSSATGPGSTSARSTGSTPAAG